MEQHRLQQAQKAWAQAVEHLRFAHPGGEVRARLAAARPVAYDGQVLVVAVPDAATRDWLADRLRSTLERLLRGALDETVQTVFVVGETNALSLPRQAALTAAPSVAPSGTVVPQEEAPPAGGPAEASGTIVPQPARRAPPRLDLHAVSLRLRDVIQQPQRIVFLPGYFLRWLPYIGTRAAWLYVALRQTYYLQSQNRAPRIRPGGAVEVSRTTLAHWSHLTPRTINNILNQQLLAPLVQVERDRHRDAHRQAPNRYIFTADLPLTPADFASLWGFLEAHGLQDDPLAALAAALQEPAARFFAPQQGPPPPTAPSLRDALAARLAADLPTETLTKALGMAELLESTLLEAAGKLFIPWYFIEHHLPRLGHTAAWLYLAARYHAEREGRARGHGVRVLQVSTRQITGWLGLKKARYGRDLVPPIPLEADWPEEAAADPPAAAFFRREPGRGSRFALAVRFTLPLAAAHWPAYRLALRLLAASGDLRPLHRAAQALQQGNLTTVMQTIRSLLPEDPPPDAETAQQAMAWLQQTLPPGAKISPGSSGNGQTFPPEMPRVSSGRDPNFPPQRQPLPSEAANFFPHVNLKKPTSPSINEHQPQAVGASWQWTLLSKQVALAPQVLEALQRQPAEQWVAWLLAVTAQSQHLKNPLGFAIYKMRAGQTPDAAFRVLARLGPEALAAYLQRHMTYGAEAVIAVLPEWRVFRQTSREALQRLMGWLGLQSDFA